jgi:DNA polymerase zeta
VPKYSYETLTNWYRGPVAAHASLLLRHLFMRVVTNLELLEEADIVTKTAYVIFFFFLEVISNGMIREFARVFGVDFFSVISRGSQFKVESFLFRIAKPESFVLISPSRHDVNSYPLTTHQTTYFGP